MHDFILALTGGAMIGLAAVILMATHGSILGVSGILNQLLPPYSANVEWRVSFVLGVVAAPIATLLITGYRPPVEITPNVALLIAGGVLVGVGTVLGSGCTSGHGVCGLSRLSARSVIATAIFMFTAIITVSLGKMVFGA